jgi:cytochrome P450
MLEMRVILPALLHKFQFRMFPMEAVNPVQCLTFRPNGGLRMIVRERNHKGINKNCS